MKNGLPIILFFASPKKVGPLGATSWGPFHGDPAGPFAMWQAPNPGELGAQSSFSDRAQASREIGPVGPIYLDPLRAITAGGNPTSGGKLARAMRPDLRVVLRPYRAASCSLFRELQPCPRPDDLAHVLKLCAAQPSAHSSISAVHRR